MPEKTPRGPGRKSAQKQTPQRQTPQGLAPQQKKPLSKEDAIRQMVENDPEKAAAILRSILKK